MVSYVLGVPSHTSADFYLELFQSGEEKAAFDGGVFIAVAAMDGIFANRGGIEFTDCTLCRLRGIGSADQLAE